MVVNVLADQVEAVLDVWYGFVASHPHLLYYFTDGQGQANNEYLAAVRKRFGNGSWIPATVLTIRSGSTTNRRSACAMSG